MKLHSGKCNQNVKEVFNFLNQALLKKFNAGKTPATGGKTLNTPVTGNKTLNTPATGDKTLNNGKSKNEINVCYKGIKQKVNIMVILMKRQLNQQLNKFLKLMSL